VNFADVPARSRERACSKDEEERIGLQFMLSNLKALFHEGCPTGASLCPNCCEATVTLWERKLKPCHRYVIAYGYSLGCVAPYSCRDKASLSQGAGWGIHARMVPSHHERVFSLMVEMDRCFLTNGNDSLTHPSSNGIPPSTIEPTPLSSSLEWRCIGPLIVAGA